jgi:hypothetical protein
VKICDLSVPPLTLGELLDRAFSLYRRLAFFEIIWSGRTPGKRLAHVRVVKESGRAMTAYDAIARNVLRAIVFLPVMYGVGVLVMMLNRQSRRIGDYVAGTIVVHDRRARAPLPRAPVRGRRYFCRKARADGRRRAVADRGLPAAARRLRWCATTCGTRSRRASSGGRAFAASPEIRSTTSWKRWHKGSVTAAGIGDA